MTKRKNTILVKAPWLAAEWNYPKNGDRTPENTPPQSGKKVWWKCAVGHEWIETVQYRFLGRRQCPYCSGRWILPGENDIKTIYPELEAEWDYDKNFQVDILSVKPTSNKKVWWRCKNCGHEWQDKILNRTKNKTKCPRCENNKLIIVR